MTILGTEKTRIQFIKDTKKTLGCCSRKSETAVTGHLENEDPISLWQQHSVKKKTTGLHRVIPASLITVLSFILGIAGHPEAIPAVKLKAKLKWKRKLNFPFRHGWRVSRSFRPLRFERGKPSVDNRNGEHIIARIFNFILRVKFCQSVTGVSRKVEELC